MHWLPEPAALGQAMDRLNHAFVVAYRERPRHSTFERSRYAKDIGMLESASRDFDVVLAGKKKQTMADLEARTRTSPTWNGWQNTRRLASILPCPDFARSK